MVKMCVVRPGELALNPRTHLVESEKGLLQAVC